MPMIPVTAWVIHKEDDHKAEVKIQGMDADKNVLFEIECKDRDRMRRLFAALTESIKEAGIIT